MRDANGVPMCSRFRSALWRQAILATLVALAWIPSHASGAPRSTNDNVSVILTIEGTVEVSNPGTPPWTLARTNQELRVGQSVRTGARSRATIRLSDLSVIRVNALTTLVLKPSRQASTTPFLDFKAGSAYFFNRTRPMETQFQTPLIAGAIRGTEFNLDVAENGETKVTLIEGEVGLNNDKGELTIVSGEQALVQPNSAPKKTPMLEAANIIQWILYYPAVLDPRDVQLGDNFDASLKLYRAGDLNGALREFPNDQPRSSDAQHIYYAELLLSVGQVSEADAELRDVKSAQGSADAIRKVIATVKHQTFTFDRAPSTATEWLAQSYYLQSQAKLADALAAAQNAAKLSPEFGFAWVRVAELEFSFGHVEKAQTALNRGLQLSPRNAQGHALRGFLLAAANNTGDALHAFDDAIALDGALANAWLGRGLCRIHVGNVYGGRQDLQVAATLEPNRSDLRSYLGKAWDQTWDTKRAEKELRLARKLDPNDPTPWLYSALLAEQNNRVNEAVTDLEKAEDLNGNRSVFRSKLLLDQDQAVRSANLARIYRDAGMEEVSVREASGAVDYDYGNFSSHLFLAESYDALRDPRGINLRYETPWLSQLLVANLLAPASAGALSQNISQQEYSRLFAGDYVGFYSDTEYFSSGEWLENVSQYGTVGNTSYSLDGFYHTDPGQRPNNDLSEFDFSAKVKQQVTASDSVYLHAWYSDVHSGDVRQYYDQNAASKTLRVRELQDPNAFIGWHHEWSPGVHTLFLGGRLADTLKLNDPDSRAIITTKSFATGDITRVDQRHSTFDYDSALEAYSAELQQIFQTDKHTFIVGGRYQTGDIDTHSMVIRNLVNNQSAMLHLSRASAYAYYTYRVIEPFALTAGVAYDTVRYPANNDIPPISNGESETSRWSPKAGFRYTPLKDTTFRGVYARSVGGVFYDTSVRLEPTEIAGFNQAYRSILPESVGGLVPGTKMETKGLALDQTFKTQTYLTVSAEELESRGSRAVGTLDAFGPALLDIPSTVQQNLNYREKTLTVTVNQLISQPFALGASYRLSRAELDDRVPEIPLATSGNFSGTANRAVHATLHQLRAYALLNHHSGFFSSAEAIWSAQSNGNYGVALQGDDFWQFNVFAGYRFPRRLAEVRVGLLNITDRDYKLNPLNLYSELPRERTLMASLRLNF
ncbi:MAG: TonB-dependent receptor [Verrucomicrobiales bacterium]|nr:TonB-dependent receptor [Verrucomicrobiales bacterium]